MSHKSTEPLATIGPDDQLRVRPISAFWAVMLAGRDQTDMVNMVPYIEEYKFHHPTAKVHGDTKPGSSIKLRLPFITNKRKLEVDELLVLPYDGGVKEMVCEEYPPMPTI